MEFRWDQGKRQRRRKDSGTLTETTVWMAFIIKRHQRAFSKIIIGDQSVEVAEGLPLAPSARGSVRHRGLANARDPS